MTKVIPVLRVLLAVAMMAVGVLHFVQPAPFVAIVPQLLPAPLALVLISGAAEIAGGLGLLIPRLLRGLLLEGSSVRWGAALRLTGVVLWDIVVSNVTVARLVLGPMGRLKPAWLRVPLASDHHRVNSLFASIITMTPGTVSAVVDEQARCIWVHALNCDDADAMVADMKARYEAPLLAIFRQDGEGEA